MKKLQFLLILTVFITLRLSAQTDTIRNYDSERNDAQLDRGFSWDRAFSGGSFGITAGSLTDIQLDPELGYQFGKYLYLGIGVDYEYYSYSDPTYGYSTTSQLFGGNIFGRYVFYKSLFAEVQVKAINWDAPQLDYLTQTVNSVNVTVPAFNVGIGYMQQVGQRSAFYVVALYDLIYGNNSPSPSPLSIQVGFNFGL